MTGHTPGPYHVLKVARTFIENEPEQFGIYAPRAVKGFFNGDLVALCPKEGDATLFAAAPELLKALKEALCVLDVQNAETRQNSRYKHLWDVITEATGETV